MSVETPTEHAATRRYLRLRAAVAGAVGVGLAIALVGGLALEAPSGDAPTRVSSAAAGGTDERTEAIEHWLTEHSDLSAEYTGSCADTGTVGAVCSSLQEDLGDIEIHVVGLHATDAGMDVLLERDNGGWAVASTAPWPELGEPYDGPPWSPMTAITAWWSERAADAYEAPDAVHLPSCDDADGIPTTEQTLLCSTLVEDLGDTRVYDSGRAGAPADVRITVAEQPDRTWAVTETLAR